MKYLIHVLQIVVITISLGFSFLLGVKYSEDVRNMAEWIFAEPEYKVFKKVKRKVIKPIKKPDMEDIKNMEKDLEDKIENIEQEISLEEGVLEDESISQDDENELESDTLNDEDDISNSVIEEEDKSSEEKQEEIKENTSKDEEDVVKDNSEDLAFNVTAKEGEIEKSKVVMPLDVINKANNQNLNNVKTDKSVVKAKEILN